ncbi:MAG: ParA family protein [Clostridiales bacterium]|nr:ParA family protein [Clostridiales bacterium]
MGKIIAFANQKGGVGKTTTCINVATYMALMGKRVLILDIDPQGNATSAVGIAKTKDLKTVYDLIGGESAYDEVIKSTIIDNLYIIPSTVDLAGAEVELIQIPQREKVIKRILDEIKESYDFILIDCPPSLALITVNALTAADSVLIPIQCEFFALEGLTQLMNTIKLIRYHLNPELDIEGVVMTMKDKRYNLTNQVSNEIIKFFNKKVYLTTIPRNIRLAEAPSHGLPVALYDANSKGAEAYLSLAEEIMKRNKTPFTKISKVKKIKFKGDKNEQ